MTNAVPALLADALTAVINAAVSAVSLETVGFTARRSYPDWDDDFKDLSGLAVDVVYVASGAGGGDLVDLDAAGSTSTEVSIDVAVRKRFAPSDRDSNGRLLNTAVDPLVRLVEQLHELFSGDRATEITLVSGTSANWIDARVRTYCDYQKLRQGFYLGLVRVRYEITKAA